MSIAKSNYESEIVRAFANKESSKIYNYIKSLSRHDTLPPTMYLNSTPALSDREKVSLFNHYFHSVFTSSPFVLPLTSSLPTPNSTLKNIDITVEDVYEALCSLDLSNFWTRRHRSKNPKILFDCYLWPTFLPLYPVLSTLYHRNGESTLSLPSTSQVTEIFRTIGPYLY